MDFSFTASADDKRISAKCKIVPDPRNGHVKLDCEMTHCKNNECDFERIQLDVPEEALPIRDMMTALKKK